MPLIHTPVRQNSGIQPAQKKQILFRSVNFVFQNPNTNALACQLPDSHRYRLSSVTLGRLADITPNRPRPPPSAFPPDFHNLKTKIHFMAKNENKNNNKNRALSQRLLLQAVLRCNYALNNDFV